MRAYEAALNAAWAMSEEWIETVLTIASRANDVSPAALEGYRAARVKGADRLTARDGVGIITARGPMFRYANLFTEFSGATSYDTLRLDLQAALDNPDIRAILLNIDSPGGEVSGVGELANAVYDARKIKRIVSYGGGTMASAAYWLAAAGSEIVISDTAVLGSIGVKGAYVDKHKVDESRGVRTHEFISSQSPNKSRAGDLDTEDGRAKIQRMIDALAQVFVESVAQYRGGDMTAEDVIAKFGAGDVKVGLEAVKAGMADRIGNFEQVVSELAGGAGRNTSTLTWRMSMDPKVTTVSKDEHDAAVTKAKADGVAEGEIKGKAAGITEGRKAEQDRFKAILADEKVKGREATALDLAIKSPDMKAEDVVAFVAGLPVGAKSPTIEQRMGGQGGDLSLGGPMKAPSVGASWGKVIDSKFPKKSAA